MIQNKKHISSEAVQQKKDLLICNLKLYVYKSNKFAISLPLCCSPPFLWLQARSIIINFPIKIIEYNRFKLLRTISAEF